MSLAKGDEVAVAFYARPTDEFYFLTSRGHVIKDTVLELPKYARNRRGIILVDRIKASPHFIVSASRLSKAQLKEDVAVRLLSSKEALITTVSDLKYVANKYGKKMLDDGYYMEIYPAQSEENDSPVQPKKEVKKDDTLDRKSTRLNSSHVRISYAVFCLKKKKKNKKKKYMQKNTTKKKKNTTYNMKSRIKCVYVLIRLVKALTNMMSSL